MKSGSLNLLEPSGPHLACYGTAIPFYKSNKDSLRILLHDHILVRGFNKTTSAVYCLRGSRWYSLYLVPPYGSVIFLTLTRTITEVTCHVRLINVGRSYGLQLRDIPLRVGSWHCIWHGRIEGNVLQEIYIYCNGPRNKSRKEPNLHSFLHVLYLYYNFVEGCPNVQMFIGIFYSRCWAVWGLEKVINGVGRVVPLPGQAAESKERQGE